MTEEQRKNLLPCPFCGSDHIKYFGTNGDSLYCRVCGAEGPGSGDGTLQGAIDKWNTRTPGVTPKSCNNCERHLVCGPALYDECQSNGLALYKRCRKY